MSLNKKLLHKQFLKYIDETEEIEANDFKISLTSFKRIWNKKIAKYVSFQMPKTDVCTFCYKFKNKIVTRNMVGQITKDQHDEHLEEVAIRYLAYKSDLKLGVSIIYH